MSPHRTISVALVNAPALGRIEAYDAPDYPSLGVGYLAARLLDHGVEVTVVDSKLERLGVRAAVERIRKASFDVVGFSCMTHDIATAAETAEAIKRVQPESMTVVGGVHASALPRETLSQFPAFDVVAVGEGEETMVELVDAIATGRKLDGIRGIAFRDAGKIVLTPPRPFVEDLDAIPAPAWRLFPRGKTYHIITSRGCPHSCIFCMQPYGRKVRQRSAAGVIAELESVVRDHQPTRIRFNDESFGLDVPRAMAILEGVVAHGLQRVPKAASMRVDSLDASLLGAMRRAGFDYIDVGIESGDPRILRETCKGLTLEQTERGVRMIKEAGIKVGGNFIIGHPFETADTARRTIEHAVRLNCDLTAIGLMVPYPGTRVAEMARQGEGGYRLLSEDWRDYNKQVGHALELESLSRREMERLQVRGYVEILLRNKRFRELASLGWRYRRGAARILAKGLVAPRRSRGRAGAMR